MPTLATRRERAKQSEDQHTRRIGYLTAVTALITAVSTLVAAAATLAAMFFA
ncbi:hypothetical protein AB0D32_04805 [Micromonospora sp. NPDC048170]|uniref:hypothetical protein n=1 Tax=Micromonospora sp. NPDC048170 TaxID=3154819 RepID=UPI0033EABDF9